MEISSDNYLCRMVYQFSNDETRNYEIRKHVTPIDDNISLLTSTMNKEDSTLFYGMTHRINSGMMCILHREDGPALISIKGQVFFFIAGRQVSIEELPCDDMIKIVLKLRYGDADTSDFYYPMYREPQMSYKFI